MYARASVGTHAGKRARVHVLERRGKRGVVLEGESRGGGGGVTWHGMFFAGSTEACFWRGGCLHADDAISPPACQSQAACVRPATAGPALIRV